MKKSHVAKAVVFSGALLLSAGGWFTQTTHAETVNGERTIVKVMTKTEKTVSTDTTQLLSGKINEVLANKTAEPEPASVIAAKKADQAKREKVAKEEAKNEEKRLKEKAEKDWEEGFPVVEGNSETANFINQISHDAVEIAREHNIYPSLMLAQAAHESANGRSGLGAAPYYNLFGIKGSYKGKSANFNTGEEYGGKYVMIRADFRAYPSWKESLGDYADLLAGGLTNNPSFYSGTWRSVAKNYREASASLTGRYATDSNYAAKVNQMIESYGLDRFDRVKKLDTSKIKVKPVVEKVKIPGDVHVVKEGESLKSIALNADTTVKEIMELNKFDHPSIYVNQWVKMPKVDKGTKQGVLETLKAMDTNEKRFGKKVNM